MINTNKWINYDIMIYNDILLILSLLYIYCKIVKKILKSFKNFLMYVYKKKMKIIIKRLE